ncbi:MAG TPA: hypothetical protein P5567_07035 [Kiritimatiellia bacterium]|nr:hypothetical protein [Kiritimatiellia bacterium]HRZ12193.1 hypothetical protein [Kiritimatiellia bacterium]HSA18049.1 hypothetical protein [Kiritimatiellia bacterium]
MNRARLEKAAGWTALAAALVLVGIGWFRSHKVYAADSEEYGILVFERITDRQLVEDATFSGVLRREGRLFSTYDRSQVRGKQACPT